MAINREHARQWLKAFDFKSLFIEELGWDTYMKLLNMAKERINIPKKISIDPAMTITIEQKKAGLNHRVPMIVTLEASKRRKPGR